jgi:hypothetical protein
MQKISSYIKFQASLTNRLDLFCRKIVKLEYNFMALLD